MKNRKPTKEEAMEAVERIFDLLYLDHDEETGLMLHNPDKEWPVEMTELVALEIRPLFVKPKHGYVINVHFIAEGTMYGSETYSVTLDDEDEAEAKAQALKLSENSQYADARIDYYREAEVIEEYEED